MLHVDVEFGWIMDYPGKAGFFAEVSNKDGVTTKELKMQMTRGKAEDSMRQWAQENNKTIILMPKGDKL